MYWPFSLHLGLLLLVFREADWNVMMLPCLAVWFSVCGLCLGTSLILFVANNRPCRYFFWTTVVRYHHICGCFEYSDLGTNSYQNCHIISSHNLVVGVFFGRKLLISFSDSLFCLVFNASYPTECLCSISLQLYKRLCTLLSFTSGENSSKPTLRELDIAGFILERWSHEKYRRCS